MTQITPLNNEHHSNLKITSSTDFSRFKEQHLIPLIAHDFIPLASEFSIVFVKNEETGQFTAVAMMGIKPGINLYCQDDKWEPSVMPSSFLNSPLSLHIQDENSDDCFVGIDLDSPLVSTDNGQALFNSEGEQTDYLKSRTEHLLDVTGKYEQTQKITQHLASKRLLTLKKLNINLGKDEKYAIDGLYIIDENVLNDLCQDDFNDLREKGLLPLIYAHLSSMHQIGRLAKKQIQFDAK
ncbi:SapC family protein [Shewanella sp.]|uniref:SapC family protein n=1 Tax=Shewanella sp. TaxID=50422 RepID=UPI00258BB5F1|nr:SapC family protein [Shewanella sp.]MCJ8303190.1 SapC family protein [Shewanella sp.]